MICVRLLLVVVEAILMKDCTRRPTSLQNLPELPELAPPATSMNERHLSSLPIISYFDRDSHKSITAKVLKCDRFALKNFMFFVEKKKKKHFLKSGRWIDGTRFSPLHT